MCIASQIGWLKATARLMQLGRPALVNIKFKFPDYCHVELETR